MLLFLKYSMFRKHYLAITDSKIKLIYIITAIMTYFFSSLFLLHMYRKCWLDVQSLGVWELDVLISQVCAVGF